MPRTITIVRWTLWLSVGTVAIGAINYALVLDWPSLNSAQVIFRTVEVAVFTAILIVLRLLPLWLMHRGSRLTVPVLCLYALAQVINSVRYPDLITVLVSVLFLVPAVLIWFPSSRMYLQAIRSERVKTAECVREQTQQHGRVGPVVGGNRLKDNAPRSITIARVALAISVGLIVIADVNLFLRTQWSVMPSAASVVVQANVITFGSLIAVALPLFPLWLISRGSALAALFASLYAVFRVVLCLLSIDVISIITAVLSVIPAVLIWLPASRSYIHAVKVRRAKVRQVV